MVRRAPHGTGSEPPGFQAPTRIPITPLPGPSSIMTLSNAERDAWLARWREGRIRFHLEQINPTLVRYANRLLPHKKCRVLVPLCGKSLDLGWLVEQGHDVVGVELSEKAVSDLFTDSGWSPTIDRKSGYEVWRYGSLAIFVSDLFALDPLLVGTFDSVWDRAALVALNQPDRARYVPWVLNRLDSGGRVLLSTLSYDQTRMEGPPYSVTANEVRSLYQSVAKLEKIEQTEVAQHNPLFIEAEIDQALAETWLIDL